MQEALERIVELLHAAWRHRWAALVAAWAVAVVGWLVVVAIPNRYEASARVYIDASSRLRPLLQGLAVDQDIDAQLNLVRQALLSRPQLAKVAEKTDLDLSVRDDDAARNRLVDRLRENITIDLDTGAKDPAGRPVSRDRLYTISYANESPQKALAVVQTLLNTFVEDTLGGNRTGSESAQAFLRQQISDYERRLAVSERALAEFKKEHVGLMPRESGDFFGRMQGEIDAVQRAQAQARVLEGQRAALVAQLRGQTVRLSGGRSVRGPDGGLLANDLDARLQEAQAQLDQATLKYTDKHPTVIALRQNIAELRARRKKEVEALRRGEPGSGALNLTSNPVYQNTMIKLNDVDVQLAAVRGEIADREKRIEGFKSMMNVAPDVEAELARLTRDYGATKAQYDALVDRLEKARLSNQAEETGVVRFEVIEPPRVGAEPVSPNRPLLASLVFVASLATAVGVALFLSRLKPTVASTRGLAHLTGLPVAGAITAIVTDRERAAERQALRRLGVAAAGLVVVFALVLLFPAGLAGRVFGA